MADIEPTDYKVNIEFINTIRDGLPLDIITKNVPIITRIDDSSQYIITEEENILLSFSN